MDLGIQPREDFGLESIRNQGGKLQVFCVVKTISKHCSLPEVDPLAEWLGEQLFDKVVGLM